VRTVIEAMRPRERCREEKERYIRHTLCEKLKTKTKDKSTMITNTCPDSPNSSDSTSLDAGNESPSAEHDQDAASSSTEPVASTDVPVTPLEMQCVNVNLNDPDMDLLEKTARRLIPIPKAFYFETGKKDLPLKTKAWHRTVASLQTVLRWSEKIGEGVAKVTGITESRFDNVTLNMSPQQWEEAEQNRQMQMERRKQYLESLETQRVEEEVATNAGLSSHAL